MLIAAPQIHLQEMHLTALAIGLPIFNPVINRLADIIRYHLSLALSYNLNTFILSISQAEEPD
jgi:hypothetical protein